MGERPATIRTQKSATGTRQTTEPVQGKHRCWYCRRELHVLRYDCEVCSKMSLCEICSGIHAKLHTLKYIRMDGLQLDANKHDSGDGGTKVTVHTRSEQEKGDGKQLPDEGTHVPADSHDTADLDGGLDEELDGLDEITDEELDEEHDKEHNSGLCGSENNDHEAPADGRIEVHPARATAQRLLNQASMSADEFITATSKAVAEAVSQVMSEFFEGGSTGRGSTGTPSCGPRRKRRTLRPWLPEERKRLAKMKKEAT